MLEELDLADMAPSGGPTPQPSTVWSRGAHAHSHHHGHANDAGHDGNASDDEGMKALGLLLWHNAAPLLSGSNPQTVFAVAILTDQQAHRLDATNRPPLFGMHWRWCPPSA